jgi:DNA-binding response OmpR family regulator
MDGSHGVVLLVEGHDASRYVLGRLLSRQGYEVRPAATVAEGLNLLEPEPDCVVLGLTLPDGRGETLLRRVREAGLNARVVVITGVRDERRLEAVRALGADAVLRKPLSVDDLCQACGGAARRVGSERGVPSSFP